MVCDPSKAGFKFVEVRGTGFDAWARQRLIGTDFLPHMDEGSIILDYWTPPGTSLTDTDEMLGQAERVILALPDVAS